MFLKAIVTLFALRALVSESFTDVCLQNMGSIAYALQDNYAQLYKNNKEVLGSIAFNGKFFGRGGYGSAFGATKKISNNKLVEMVVKIGANPPHVEQLKGAEVCSSLYAQQWLSRHLPDVVFEMNSVRPLNPPNESEKAWCMGQMPVADAVLVKPLAFLQKSFEAFKEFIAKQKGGKLISEELRKKLDEPDAFEDPFASAPDTSEADAAFWNQDVKLDEKRRIDLFGLLGMKFFRNERENKDHLGEKERKENLQRIKFEMNQFFDGIEKQIIESFGENKFDEEEFRNVYNALKSDWMQIIMIAEDLVYKIILLNGAGIMHADLSTANVFLVRSADTGAERQWLARFHDFDLIRVIAYGMKEYYLNFCFKNDRISLLGIIGEMVDRNSNALPFNFDFNANMDINKLFYSYELSEAQNLLKDKNFQTIPRYNHEEEVLASQQELEAQKASSVSSVDVHSIPVKSSTTVSASSDLLVNHEKKKTNMQEVGAEREVKAEEILAQVNLKGQDPELQATSRSKTAVEGFSQRLII